MTEIEGRYAQMEKEVLAAMWACERFQNYILGKKVTIETDHKPSVCRIVNVLTSYNQDII